MAITKWDDKLLKTRGNYTVTITPNLAARLLELNKGNRPPKKRAIAQYARDMKAGNWNPDASDLKFSTAEELLDGQNRLLACLLSDSPFTTLVRTGLVPSAKDYVDTGVKRTAADVLRMHGMTTSPTAIAAAVGLWVRFVDRVENHNGKRLTNPSGGGVHAAQSQIVLTHKEILDFLEKHPTIEEFAPMAESIRRQVMPAIPSSSILTFLAMTAEKDPEATKQFGERLISGAYTGPGDPMIALVQYAARVRGNVGTLGSPGHRGRVAQESHLQAMNRVWNATKAGQKIEGRIHIKITDKLVMPK
jgi:hypothetical protein